MIEKYGSPFVVMGVGVPGSGKTTILKPFAEGLQVVYLCPDDIREELTGDPDDQSQNDKVWQVTYDRAKEELEGGRSLVVDATHADRTYRMEGVQKYHDFGARAIIALQVEAELATALRRNSARTRQVPEHVIRRMHEALATHPPTKDEGFDDTLIIKT